jgi:hypothetical protein
LYSNHQWKFGSNQLEKKTGYPYDNLNSLVDDLPSIAEDDRMVDL